MNANGSENTEEVRRFWRHLYGEGKGFLCIATADRVGDELEDVRHEYFPYPTESKDAAEFALLESERGREVYHTVHLLTTRERKKKHAAPIRALWADLDGAAVPDNPKPTAVVESSPGRFHAYWLLSKPLAPERAENINRRLTYAIGADTGKWSRATLLRPPHTTNYKRAEPTSVTLASLDTGRGWDSAEIDAIFPAESGRNGHGGNGSEAEAGERQGEPPVRLGRSALVIWRGEDVIRKPTGEIDRSRSLHRIGGVLARGRAAEGAIVAALRERDETLGWRKYTGRADADKRYSDIAAGVAADAEARLGPTPDAEAKPVPKERGADAASFHLTDLGNAERLRNRHGEDLRYVHPWNKYLVWDGKRWATDDSGEVERRAVATVRAIYPEAAAADDKQERRKIAQWAERSESRSRIDAMISMTRNLTGIPVAPDDLDADTWLFNTQNGTVDLRTGDLRPHRREDLITKIAPVEYDLDAEAPRFARFLQEIFDGDEGVIRFVQRFAGYSLTGSTEERAFAILHGRGKNGKSTLVELLQEAMGDYAATADTETILAKRYQGVGNDVAALRGARFVATAEIEQGRALAESKVKSLTGSDTVTARFLYSEPFSFKPEFKLWLSTNNKPVIRGTDDAIWDRIRLIPFTQRFEGDAADAKLSEKLRAELPGVLAWMVAGCVDWLRDGRLGEPDKVRAATEGYRAEQDTLAGFVDECCIVRPDVWCKFGELHAAYTRWCEEANEQPEKKRRFADRLTERGYASDKGAKNVAIRRGIALRHDDPDPSRVTDPPPKSGPEPPDPTADGGENGNRVTDPPNIGNPQNTRKTEDSGDRVIEGYQKSNNFASTPRGGESVGNTVTIDNSITQGVKSPPGGGSVARLTDEQTERVNRLIGEGMSPAWARAEVLGDGAT